LWTGAENLAPTGIRSPDRPARSESLYRLWYPGPLSDAVESDLGGGHGLYSGIPEVLSTKTT